MDPSRIICAKELFVEALGLTEGERSQFLAWRTSGDPELRAVVEDLLAGADAAPVEDSLLDWSAGSATRSGESDGRQQIGPYRLLRRLGEGGMGAVHLAEREWPLQGHAAVKVVTCDVDAAQVLQRFDQERRALALMSHPNIATAFDVGTDGEGRPYFAMEYVEGDWVTEYSDRQRLGLAARVALIEQVCHGVQHAHQKGIVHRDIKPGNVLVVEVDGQPQVKVIDFGIAKALEQRLTEHTIFTQCGQIVGTPEYMSPEQAGLSETAVDVRSDVYSIGVLLHELLTGELPFRVGTEVGQGLFEFLDRIRSEEPARPSLRVARAAKTESARVRRGYSSSERWARDLTDDLDWIVLRCLEKDPERRYPSSSELAADLRRYRTNQAVAAGPPTGIYRLRKFARRHRGLVASVLTMIVALIVGWVSVWQMYRVATVRGEEVADSVKAVEAALDREQKQRRRADRASVALGEAEGTSRSAFELASSRLADLERMQDVPECEELLRGEALLWPAHPDKVAAMDDWLRRARAVVARGNAHRRVLRGVVARAENPEAAAGGAEAPRFADLEDRFLYETIRDLLRQVDRLADPLIGELAARRERAAGLREDSIEAYRARWDRVLEEVSSSEDYAGTAPIPPQLGLVPLGADPASGLQEFAVLHTGEIPARSGEGRLLHEGRSAVVLVLIPAGRFWMGAQRADPNAPHYDAYAMDREQPVHEVRLDAFLIGKYEVTQGQWLRITGSNPSRYAWREGEATGYSAAHPVEELSWIVARQGLVRFRLDLPTEAQWEYAAGAAGQADFVPDTGIATNLAESFTHDGFPVHAPVGSFPANPFGIHDVVGNVWEWCLDSEGGYRDAEPAPGTGYRQHGEKVDGQLRERGIELLGRVEHLGSRSRVGRSGGFGRQHWEARITHRHFERPGRGWADSGVRAARGVDREDSR